MPMTIEGAPTPFAGPSFGRFLSFVALTTLLSVVAIVAFHSGWARFDGYRPETYLRFLYEALVFGVGIWGTVAVLAIFPGYWLYRVLYAALRRYGVQPGTAAVLPSVVVFALATQGPFLIVFFFTERFLNRAMSMGWHALLYGVPIAAFCAWVLLRSLRGAT